MLLPRFNYHEPESLTEAVEMMGYFQDKAKLLAGGTDLLVNMKRGLASPKEVVYLGRIPDLAAIDWPDGQTQIGPLVTAAVLARAGGELGAASVAAEAAAILGSPLIRNRATVGGNIVTARPAADLLPPLMVLQARLILTGTAGERRVELNDFCTGPGQTLIEPTEILTAIVLPPGGQGCGGGYFKLGARKTLEISIVNAAAYLRLDEDGTIKEARIVLGAVGPKPLRAPSAEKLLLGERPQGPEDPIFSRAGLVAQGEARPIDDHRGSAVYRRLMADVLTRRALGRAWLKAQGEKS